MNNSNLFLKRVKTGCVPDCPNRKPGCHDHCETYLENKKAYEEYKHYVKCEREKQRILDYIPPKSRERRS